MGRFQIGIALAVISVGSFAMSVQAQDYCNSRGCFNYDGKAVTPPLSAQKQYGPPTPEDQNIQDCKNGNTTRSGVACAKIIPEEYTDVSNTDAVTYHPPSYVPPPADPSYATDVMCAKEKQNTVDTCNGKSRSTKIATAKLVGIGALEGVGSIALQACGNQQGIGQATQALITASDDACSKAADSCTTMCDQAIQEAKEKISTLQRQADQDNHDALVVTGSRVQQLTDEAGSKLRQIDQYTSSITSYQTDRNFCSHTKSTRNTSAKQAGAAIGGSIANATFCKKALQAYNAGLCTPGTTNPYCTGDVSAAMMNCTSPNDPLCTGGVNTGAPGGAIVPTDTTANTGDTGGGGADNSFAGYDSKAGPTTFGANDSPQGGGNGAGAGMAPYQAGPGPQNGGGKDGPNYRSVEMGLAATGTGGYPFGGPGSSGVYGSRGSGSNEAALNLNDYLPGGKLDPNGRAPASADNLAALGITGPNALSNFEKVTRMMNKKRALLKPADGK